MAQVHDNPDQQFIKRPSESRKYAINYIDDMPEGVLISASTWSTDNTDVTIDNQWFLDAKTGLQVSGGLADQDVIFTNNVTLDNGETRSPQIMVKIRE